MEVGLHLQPQRQSYERFIRVVLWTLVVLAAVELVVRGPVRYLHERSQWNDLSQNYTASKLWLNGQSPANPRNFVALWKQQSGARLDITDIRTHLSPPLGGLVVMAPLAAIPWKAAKLIWLLILLISFSATVWALVTTSGQAWNDIRALTFVAACFALAPFHTGLASGNTSILVIGLCAVAIWSAGEQRDATAGVLFGVACSIKPQLGAFLVLYYLVRLRWRLFSVAVGCTALLNLIAVLYLYARGTSWIQDYLNNAKGFVTANNIDSFTSENPARFTLINLQVPFFSIARNYRWANWLAFVVSVLIVCAWLYLIFRRKHLSETLSLGAISVIALLPVYHRFYDAGLLAVPLCWCIREVSGRSKAVARAAMILMTPFLIPGAAIAEKMAAQNRIPGALTGSWWWDCILMPHETWALLVLCLVLLYGMRTSAAHHTPPLTLGSRL